MSKKTCKQYFLAATVLVLCVALISLVYLASIYFARRPVVIAPTGCASDVTPMDRWQILGDPHTRHQVFSAFFDNRQRIIGKLKELNYRLLEKGMFIGTIRIFGIFHTFLNTTFYCSYVNATRHTIDKVPAFEVRPIHEHQGLAFSAYMVACPLYSQYSKSYFELPKYVVVTYDSDPLTTTNPVYVPIRYSHEVLKGKDPSRKLALCVGPVHSYSQVRRIVEYVRITQLMGVEKIYFYYFNSTLAVKKVLDYFHEEGSAQVLEWNLRGYKFLTEVRDIGNFVVFNECVYRATFVDNFKYVAIVDLDELLVSFEYPSLVKFIEKLDDGGFDSLIFRNVFFYKIDQPASFISPPGVKNKFLYTQARTVRTRHPFPSGFRSKYVVKARNVIEMGNHYVWRDLHKKAKTVRVQKGLVFHYRDECIKMTCDAQKQNETIMSRYGPALWELVDKTCGNIFTDGRCPVGD